MSTVAFEILFIGLLLVLNGVLAMAEISLVASRRGRLKQLSDAGNKGASLALELSKSPGRFLSTVQVGITLFGVLSGVVGGARLAGSLAGMVDHIDWVRPWAEFAALAIVSTAITFLSVLIGELVPKRLALNSPERIASWIARPMNQFSIWTAPLVNFLNSSSDLLLALLGVKKNEEASVSEEEVRVMIDEGLSSGVFKKEEKEMVEGVFDLDEQTADDLMTPRARIVWLSVDDPDEENWRRIAGSGHSHFPVYQRTRDNVLGMVSVKALWANLSLAGQAELRSLVTPPLYVPETMPASKLIAEFKRTGKHIALVVDEFGGLQGLVSLNDVMMAIVGNLPEREQRFEPKAVRRDDGSWLIDALLEIDEVKKILQIEGNLPDEEDAEFSTLGGFVLARLGHIPQEGESFAWGGFRFEIMDMDRQRVDKVLVTNLPAGHVPAEPDSTLEA
ncbi:MAG: hemolysin family protein [Terrimicrobiaceae bacterium]